MPSETQSQLDCPDVYLPLIVGRHFPGEDVALGVAPGVAMPNAWLDFTPDQLQAAGAPQWFIDQHVALQTRDGGSASQWFDGLKTGISSRPVASPEEALSVMGVAAVRDLVKKLHEHAVSFDPQEASLVLASTSAISLESGTAPFFHDRARLDEIAREIAAEFGISGTQTINNACAGGVGALTLAARTLNGGGSAARDVVVLAVERFFSDLTNPHDLGTRPLFGDGAAAMLMTRRPQRDLPGWLLRPIGWRSVHDDSPEAQGLLHISRDDARIDGSGAEITGFAGKFAMNGPEVFKAAVAQMPQVIVDLADYLGVDKSEIQLILAHQANGRIVEAMKKAFKRLGIECAVPMEMGRGNLSSVSILHLLERMIASGGIDLTSAPEREHFLVAMTAIGIGVWTRSMLFEAVRGGK